jgi:hypothetical protein
MSGERGGQGIRSVCGNLFESGWLILSQKAIPHNPRVPTQSPFQKQVTEKCKDGGLCNLFTVRKKFQSFTMTAANRNVASSICLRPTNFQNPERTSWTHTISSKGPRKEWYTQDLFCKEYNLSWSWTSFIGKMSTDFHKGIDLVTWRTDFLMLFVLQNCARSRFRLSMKLLKCFNLHKSYSRTMAFGSSQPLTKMSTRNLPGE